MSSFRSTRRLAVLPFALALALGGGTGVVAQDEAPRIAFLSAASENGFNQAILQGIEGALGDSGATVDIFDGQFSATVQFNTLQDLMAQGAHDAFIIAANDGVGIASLVEQAIADGYKVAAVNNGIGPDLNSLEPQIEGITTTAGSNQHVSSVQQAEFAVELCADRDPCRVVLFHGNLAFPFDTVRQQGWLEVFDANDSIEVVGQGEGEYSREVALGVMQDLLQRNSDGIDLVISAADQHIFGAELAIDAIGAEGILLLGRGAATESVEALRAGRWSGSFVDLPATQGRLATEQILKDLAGDTDIIRSFDTTEFSPIGPIATEETLALDESFLGEWSG
jgi:ribose transport system substrate-binding protein